MSTAGIPPGKSDASGGIGPRPTITSTSGFSARCRPMRPISQVEFQLIRSHNSRPRYKTIPCIPIKKHTNFKEEDMNGVSSVVVFSSVSSIRRSRRTPPPPVCCPRRKKSINKIFKIGPQIQLSLLCMHSYKSKVIALVLME